MENPQCKTSLNSAYQTLLSMNLETEKEICVFYTRVLKTLFKESVRDFFIFRSALGKIRSYSMDRDCHRDKAVSFHAVSERFAYIFAYGAIHSAIMYDRFSNMLKLNQNILKKITTMKLIRLCFLGGGPALEAISIIKLLNDIIRMLSNGEREALDVYVTIVDMRADWKKEGEYILNAAQNSFCNSNYVKIYFSFVEADLTKYFSEDLREVIKKAHIVTMFKCLSDVENVSFYKFMYDHSESCLTQQGTEEIINSILSCMSFQSCLFFLDSSGGSLFNRVKMQINNHESTVSIYGPCAHNCHVLSMDSIDKLSFSLGSVFRYLKCTTQSTTSCSAWLKVRNVIKVDGLYCNTVHAPEAVLRGSEQLQWKKKKPKIKKVLQSPMMFREIFADPSEIETANEETDDSD